MKKGKTSQKKKNVKGRKSKEAENAVLMKKKSEVAKCKKGK